MQMTTNIFHAILFPNFQVIVPLISMQNTTIANF